MLKKYPFYLKTTVILFGLILLVYVLYNLREIMIPLAFAALFAILLNPVANFLQKKKFRKAPSIILSMLMGVLFFAGLVYFLSMQLSHFGDELPHLKEKFESLTSNLQNYVQSEFGVAKAKQQQYISEAESGLKPILGQTVGTLLGTLSVIFLLPVYTFLLLFYKKLLLNFLYEVFDEKNSTEVGYVLQQSKGAIQSYMVGLLIEALIVAILNSLALWIIGVKYALLLGVMGALLNMLPYIGGLIAIALPVLIATITKDGYQTQLLIVGAYLVIQFIDNNLLVPLVVSSKVQINALFSIVIVLLGGALWGIPGMFLSIPFIGVMKIVFDRVPELQPWGKLLGDEVPERHKGELLERLERFRRRRLVNEETREVKVNG
jgi:predicted PurR-regulated permease PerM